MRRKNARAVSLMGALIVAPLVLGITAPASAASTADGLWYFDAFNIQKAHDAGLTGEGVTIAVFDSQVNLDVPTLQGADVEVNESSCYDDNGELIEPTTTAMSAQHGTNVLSYLVGSGEGYDGQAGIKGIVPDARIIYTVVGEAGEAGGASISMTCNAEDPNESNSAFADGVFAALDEGVDIITMSVSMNTTEDSEIALATALHEGVLIIASVSNDSLNDPNRGGFPSLSNGVVGVQSIDSSGRVQGDHIDPSTDVVGPGVDVLWQGDGSWEKQKLSTGTSIATPIVAGFAALAVQKFPDATGNQILQSLIRNTDAEDHPLNYDPDYAFGYGFASATHMLKVDPTKYDDVNLLVDDDPSSDPNQEMIADPPERVTDAWDENQSVETGAFEILILPLLLGLVGVLGVAAVIALVVVLIVRLRRRKKTTL